MAGPPSHDAVERLWRLNPVFAALDAETRADIARRFPAVDAAPRTPLLQAATAVDDLFVLLAGTVRVFHRAPDGREALVKLLRAPGLFAEFEVLCDLDALENVDAFDHVTVARIPRTDYVALLSDHPAAMLTHLRHLAAAFAVATRNEQQIFAQLDVRVANLLLSYADCYGDLSGDESTSSLAVTLDDLAHALGATRRSVSRIISEWRRRGLVDRRDDGGLLLLATATLEELAAPIRHSLVYQMGMPLDALAQRAALSAGELEVIRGPARWIGRRYPVEEEIVVGRQPPARLLVPDDTLCPQHCRIFRGPSGGRFWIEDWQSLNGCEVNGKRVETRARLHDGDEVALGGVTLRFHRTSQPQSS